MAVNGAAAKRAWLLVDLTYGDAAKGATVDFLARKEPVHTVVRFNGGPQAGHNVMTPDGRRHTFSQFGSGSFVPGVMTYLSRYMLVNPLNAFQEAAHLRAVGVTDAFERLVVHPEALVITPYHVATNRLREIARGANRHGSCGMGIGETVADSLSFPDEALRAGDLASAETVTRKLAAARERLWVVVRELLPLLGGAEAAAEMESFADRELSGRYVEYARAFAARTALGDEEWLRDRMRSGVAVFEAAQGTLIDEDYGFHPHTTWSHTTVANAERMLRETGYGGQVIRMGLVRAYSTRHGAGPFVPEDALMTASLPDAYNPPGAWQGAMRCGPFDAVATRYALSVNPGVDRLGVSHLDCVERLEGGWPFVRRYAHGGMTDDELAAYDAEGKIMDLRRVEGEPDLAYQERLTGLLGRSAAVVERVGMEGALEVIEQETGVPVELCAWGPMAEDRVLGARRRRESVRLPALAAAESV